MKVTLAVVLNNSVPRRMITAVSAILALGRACCMFRRTSRIFLAAATGALVTQLILAGAALAQADTVQPGDGIDTTSLAGSNGRNGSSGLSATHGFYLDGAIWGGHSVYSSSRTTLEGTASGGTGGAEFSTFGSAGYDFKFRHLTVGPVAVELSLRAAWEHEYKYSALPIAAGFAGIPGPFATFYGPNEGHESAILSAGGTVDTDDRKQSQTHLYIPGRRLPSTSRRHRLP